MSELILKIDADEAGLRAVKEATRHLKEVLSSGGLKGSTEDIRALETSLRGLSVQAAATQKEMTGLAASVKQATAAQAQNSGVVQKYARDTQEAAIASRSLHDATRGLAGASGALWLSYGNLLPMMAGYVTMASAIKGVKLNADFESTTVYTQSIAEATGDYSMKLGVLREKLLAVREVQDTAGELAAASKELVKAGFSEAQAVGEIADMSRTATVVQEGLADVTKGVAAQYRAWNVEAVGAERGVSSLKQVANQMGFAAAASATDFGELNSMLAYTTELGPITAAGFSELLAALAGMTNMGIRGTKAATGLRSAILNLQHPSEKLSGELSRLKVPFSSTTEKGELKNLTTLFDDLGKSLAPLSTKARVDILESIFSVRSLKGGAAMLTMLSNAAADGKFNFRGLTAEIEAAGQKMVFIDDAAKKVNDTLDGQWKLLKADVAREFTQSFEDANGAARGLVDALRQAASDGTLRSLIDTVADLTKGLVSLVKYAVEFKEVLGTLATGLIFGKIAEGIEGIALAIGAATSKQWLFNAAAKANPYIAAVTAVSALSYLEDTTSRWAMEDKTRVAARESGIRSWMGNVKKAPDFLAGPENPSGAAPASAGPLARKNASTPQGDEREASSAMQAAADKAARLREWHLQRGLQLEEVARKAKADIREASLKDSLAFADAEHKALLFGDEEYLNKTRKLRQENLQAKLDDAIASEITLSAKVAEAQSFADKNKGSQKAQQDLAKYQDQLTAIQGTVRELNADATAMPKLFELEDVSRLNAAYASLRGIADTARELRDNSKIERSIASMNEADAKKIRDLRKVDLELEKSLQKLFMERKLHQADGSETQEAEDLRTLAREQKGAVQQVYEDEAAARGDWLGGVKKGWEDYAFAASNAFKSTGDIVGRVFENMEDVFINFVKTGKFSFKDLIDSMLSDILRLEAKRAVSGLAGAALGALGGAWVDSSTALGGLNMTLSSIFHSGVDSVGSGSAPQRSVPAALFSNAPRFHNGLAPDEFPAILQTGERVLSRKQVAQERSSGGVVVNIVEAPGKGGQRSESTDGNGTRVIDILVEQITRKMAGQIGQGKGLAPVLEGRYALNSAFGMVR